MWRGGLLLAAAALLAGCAATAPTTLQPPPQAAPPAPYTAETTHARLVGQYPQIRIASREPTADVQVLADLVYADRGGRRLALDLVLPRSAAGPLTTIVLVHGGGWRSGERANLLPLAIGLARRGIAAATVSYRLSGEARYPAAVQDVKAAIRWLRERSAVHGLDPARFAVGGGSAGGQIAALVGVTNGLPRFDLAAAADPAGSAVQAIVNIDGLSDFTSPAALVHEDDPRKHPSAAGAWLGGRYAEQRALWHEASPISHVGPGTPPVLFVVSAEERFSLGHREMMDRLAALGVASERVSLPGTPHSFWLFEPWLAPTVEAVAGFLQRQLGAPTPGPGPVSR